MQDNAVLLTRSNDTRGRPPWSGTVLPPTREASSFLTFHARASFEISFSLDSLSKTFRTTRSYRICRLKFFNDTKTNERTPFVTLEKSLGSRAALTMIRPQHDGGGVTEQQGFTEATLRYTTFYPGFSLLPWLAFALLCQCPSLGRSFFNSSYSTNIDISDGKIVFESPNPAPSSQANRRLSFRRANNTKK